MNLIWWLRRIQSLLPAGVVYLWAHFERPHRQALNQTGIRIVSIDSGAAKHPHRDDVWEALKLLQEYDPLNMRRVTKYISIIFLRTQGAHGTYMAFGRVCFLNLSCLKDESSAKARQLAIAGLLVHEATHGVIDHMRIPSRGSIVNKIERICCKQQSRVLNRLASKL